MKTLAFLTALALMAVTLIVSQGLQESSKASAPPKSANVSRAAGIHYARIDEQSISGEAREHLQKELRNLQLTGSLSGGLVTHEFSMVDLLAEKLRQDGIDKIRKSLAITPTDLGAALDTQFSLVGADSQSKLMTLGSVTGWTGFFQIYKARGADRWAELSENQFDVLSGDGTVISPEFLNEKVMDFPATFEHLRDPQGAEIHNVLWTAKDRLFQLSTRNISRQETLELASKVTAAFVQMPHGGWTAPYERDENNPLHRMLGK